MNYLAHLLLSDHCGGSLVGNLLGDFVKGRVNGQYSNEIANGIILHRKIDSYTDLHIKGICQRDLISHARRRFAGIIVDVCYDHFLSKHWVKYTQANFNEFINSVYNLLFDNKAILPQKLQMILPRMVNENWLASYQDIDGVGIALNRISMRFKRKNNLYGSVEELTVNYDALEEEFLRFFPGLMEYTKICNENFPKTPSFQLLSEDLK